MSIPLVNNKFNVMLSLNTNNLLEEQKELAYNSIGTVFADKFDIEFKVREDVGDNFNIADEIVSAFYFKNSNDLSKFLHKTDISNYQVIGNLLKIYAPTSKDNLIKAYNLKNILQKEGLYDKQKSSGIKGCKRYDVSRVGRCGAFRSWFNARLESGYEPRGGSGDNYTTIRNATRDLGLGEKAFFREKLDICIKNYDMLFEKAIRMSNVKNMSKLINEFFDTFNIPNNDMNMKITIENKTLSSVILKD